jgi:hypothetical protein
LLEKISELRELVELVLGAKVAEVALDFFEKLGKTGLGNDGCAQFARFKFDGIRGVFHWRCWF